MSLFSRKPARRPHPDAAVEAELQRLISLQQMARRRDDEIARFNRRLRRLEHRMPLRGWKRLERTEEGLAVRRLLAASEAEATRLHEDVAKALAALPEDAALWLGPDG